MNPARLFRLVLGLVLAAGGITVLFLGMRSVMAVGGFCAEGGPYQIAVDCPKGVAGMMPLSILALIVGCGLYLSGRIRGGPNYTFLFWSALFLALGWNFFDFAIHPPGDQEGIVWSWMTCAIVFAAMGGGPLLLIGPKKTFRMLFGGPEESKLSSMLWGEGVQALRTAADLARTAGEASASASSWRTPSPGARTADELERLARLHRQGALTDEEFAAAKRAALGGDGG